MKVNGWVALVTGTPGGKAAAPFFPGDPGGSSKEVGGLLIREISTAKTSWGDFTC